MGTPLGHVFKPLAERLDALMMPEPNSGCWLWTGAIAGGGYGVVWNDGKRRQAHRVVYEMHCDPIPDGMQLDHLCRTRSCCNPDHLEPVTGAENLRRSPLMDRKSNNTHCPQGHEYTAENIVWQTTGARACRECKRIYDRARIARIRHG
jgi:hypothetical protein